MCTWPTIRARSCRHKDSFATTRRPCFLPERPYTREAVLALVAHGRDAYRSALAATTEAQAEAPCGFPWLEGLSRAELYLYSLRHVQHHAAKLNLLLREATGATPGWVAHSRTPLEGA